MKYRLSKLSVVIPVFNDIRKLKTCLECLSNQTLRPMELLVVDGGSIDGSIEYALEMGCRVIKNPKTLSHFGKGVGIYQSSGDYIALIDCDNYILDSNYFERAIALFERNLDLAVLEPSSLSVEYNRTLINRYLSIIGTDDVIAYLIGYTSRGLTPHDNNFSFYDGFWRSSSTKTSLGIYYPLGANGAIIRKSVIPPEYCRRFLRDGFHHVKDTNLIIERNNRFYFGLFDSRVEHDHCPTIRSYLSKKYRRWGRSSSESTIRFRELSKGQLLLYVLKRFFSPPPGYGVIHYTLATLSLITYFIIRLEVFATGRIYR